jgi:hypothetical protein
MPSPLREVFIEEVVLLRNVIGVRKTPSSGGKRRKSTVRLVSYRAMRHHRFYVQGVKVCAQVSRFVREKGSANISSGYLARRVLPTIEMAAVECLNEIRLARGGTTALASALLAIMARLHLLASEFDLRAQKAASLGDVWSNATVEC